jgi:hypothetical protein
VESGKGFAEKGIQKSGVRIQSENLTGFTGSTGIVSEVRKSF